MLNNKLRGILAVAVVLSMVLSGLTVFASTGTKAANITYRDIKVYVDGALASFVDGNGNSVEPFIYNGSTYLPLKALANAFGKDVKWDGETSTITIGGIPEKFKAEPIATEDFDENGGADSYGNGGDNAASRYYKNPDFYNLTSDSELTIISHFKTVQQTTEWACGNTTSLMVLNHFGKTDLSEKDIAIAMTSSVDEDTPGALPGSADNFPEYGTNVKEIYEFFNTLNGFKVVESSYKANYTSADLLDKNSGCSDADIGNLKPKFFANSLYASENKEDTDAWVDDAKDAYFVKWLTGHLKANRPVMVEWGDWDGHWQAIIGYDNNGTPGVGDDILIFADPYDTSDHWQDGYYIFPLERWFYMWADRNVAPKPLQLQPFVVVDKK